MLRSLLREPLVHFLLLGAALFLLDAWLRPLSASSQGSEIVVGEARIRSLAQNFRRTWQRPPTRPELDGLIQDFVREEVLYREALALGLDKDDTIVRRRLRQKMEFIADEAAALAKPTDQELAAYLAAHAEAFRVEPRATFTQVYLDPRRRAETLEADAKRLLDELNAGSRRRRKTWATGCCCSNPATRTPRRARWPGCSAPSSRPRSSSRKPGPGSARSDPATGCTWCAWTG